MIAYAKRALAKPGRPKKGEEKVFQYDPYSAT